MTRNQKYYAENREREKARAKAWREANPEKAKAATAKWREENRDRFLAMKRAWRQTNKEHVIEYRRGFYVKNKDTLNAVSRAYKEKKKEELARKQAEYNREHPEGNRFRRSLRRAAEKRATPPWANKKAMLAIYAEAARLTREIGIPHHVDHVYPLQSDLVCGLHCEANLQILTALDNNRKKNRLPRMGG